MTEDDQIRITFRMPAVVRDALVEAAKSNNRSMNAEIIARLEQSFQKPSQGASWWVEPSPEVMAEIDRRAADWGCSKTQALIRMTLEELKANS